MTFFLMFSLTDSGNFAFAMSIEDKTFEITVEKMLRGNAHTLTIPSEEENTF